MGVMEGKYFRMTRELENTHIGELKLPNYEGGLITVHHIDKMVCVVD